MNLEKILLWGAIILVGFWVFSHHQMLTGGGGNG